MSFENSLAAAAPMGAWRGTSPTLPWTGAALQRALGQLHAPVAVVRTAQGVGVGVGGVAELGRAPDEGGAALLGHVAPLTPSQLGDASFRAEHGVRFAYVAGEMANGIASEAMVEAVARAGMLGVFGAAGLSLDRVTQALDRLARALPELPWGVNLIHSPDDPALELALADLFLARGLRFVSASAYLDLTLPVVKYRLAGIHQDAAGRVVVPNRLMAKVSRVEVARKFLSPAPERFVRALVAEGFLTEAQAALAAKVPLADDVTAEADSGGHTDNRPLVVLLPALQALRDELSRAHGYPKWPRIGAAGGLSTPASVASAFGMGAAYVVTGSVNQCTREAGTSDAVRAMLAQAASTDVAMAPAADMFELGVNVQVLSRGTLFAVRAKRLYELYRAHAGVAQLPPDVVTELEEKYFKQPLAQAWAGCEAFFGRRDPAQLERAAREPKHQLALLFRAYLGQASRWANAGEADRKIDYQVWCGPAMGAFNDWVKGSHLEPWSARGVVEIAQNLLVGAAVLARLGALRTLGLPLPEGAEALRPLPAAELEAALAPAAPATLAPALTTPALPSVEVGPSPEPIAIVGLGALFPNAQDLTSFWRLLRTGVDAVGEVPPSHWGLTDYFDADPKAPDKTYTRRGAFLSRFPFDPTEFGIPPAILEATDTSQLLGLVVARMAMEDAGYGDGVQWDRRRASVLLGVTGTQELVISLGARLGYPKWKQALADAGVDDATAKDVVERISRSYVGWQENSFPGLLGNVVAGRIANRLDFGGTNCVIDAACASSLGAVHLAVLELQAKRSDLVLTGGVDCLNDIFMHLCFSKTPALSPTGDVRPFSDKADGTLLGEGLGMLVLKRLSDAEAAGDRVYAVIRGVGTSSDGRAKSIYAPLPSGQARALKDAYAQAKVGPRDIALLEAHGTGTKAGDAAEFEALQQVYREDSADPAWCVLGSVKSQVGHTKAAAGAAGLMKAALALRHKVLPPTLKVERPNPALGVERSPFALSGQARPWLARGAPRRAAVSSFGFGGSNFHLVLEEYSPTRPEPAWDGAVQLFAFSAASGAALLSHPLLQRLAALVGAPPEFGLEAALAALADESRRGFSASHAARLVLVSAAGTDLAALLAKAKERLSTAPAQTFLLSEGAAYACGDKPGKLAFVFPGQGSQHLDMARELACVFPEVLAALEELPGTASLVYPLPTFDEEEVAKRDATLTRTDNAQPAIGLVSLGLLHVLQRFGVRPELVAGHSYGELVALHAAGALDRPALLEASRRRGVLMAQNGVDRGTMLAVLAPLAQVEALLAQAKLDVVLANRNAPNQGVLSGPREAIDEAERLCADRGLKTARLKVGAAFHSTLVAGAANDFRKALEALPVQAPALPVVGNSLADVYPLEPALVRDVLGHQLARPVLFSGVVEKLHALGARTFVEVGPKATLTALVKANLKDKDFHALAVDAQTARGGLFDLAMALARVAALGHPVDLSPWQRTALPPRVLTSTERPRRMTVPLTGANYRAPFEPLPKRAPRPAASVAPTQQVAVAQPAPTASAHLQALEALQAQTARLHQLFLETQLQAQSTLQALASGQGAVALPLPSLAALPASSQPFTLSQPLAPAALPARPVVSAQPQTLAPAAVVDVTAALLDIVAEATGYPRETLQVGMDLEADLGVDSIKRVEILSTVAKRVPGAPSVNPEKLSGLKTLANIVTFLEANRPAQPALVAPTAVAPTAVGPSAPVSSATVDVPGTLLDVVAELTGYPKDTLALRMELEADLGVDSIKRVEILSAVSKRLPNAPSVNPEKLSSLKTLEQVVAFLSAGLPVAPPAVVAPSVLTPSVVPGARADASAAVLDVVAELTGYPRDTLALGMELEADLGVDSIKRVEILSALSKRLPGAPSVNPEKLSALKTLAQIAQFVGGAVSPAPAASSVARPAAAVEIEEALARRPVVVAKAPDATPKALPSGLIGVVQDEAGFAAALVTALNRAGAKACLVPDERSVPAKLAGLLLPFTTAGWTEAGEQRLKALLHVLRAAAPAFPETERGGFVASLSVGDGAFGRGGAPVGELAWGVHGLVKAVRHEWPHVSVRCLDVDGAEPADVRAERVVAELRTDGPLEVGLSAAGRVQLTLGLEAQPSGAPVVSRGDVVLLTGGARGVTAACAQALGAATGATLVLLGRSPAPVDEAPWLAAAADEAAIKRALLEHAAAGTKPTPRELGDGARAVLAAREIRATLRALATAQVRAAYVSCDVRDAASVRAALDAVRQEHGAIRGLVHGAGVLRDKRLTDKRVEDVDAVVDTKVAGLRTLLEATREDALRFVGLFASITGRLGRRGQTDYALANQALVSIAHDEALRRPGCRVVAFDWGPWESGMVTPALKAEFAKEGVGLIPLATGAQAFVDALRGGPGFTELTVGSGFGAGDAPAWQLARTLAVDLHHVPALADHQLAGKPVLPFALALEWLTDAAQRHRAPAQVVGLEDARVLKGVTLDGATTLGVWLGKPEQRAERTLLPVELRGPGDVVHVRATAVLAEQRPSLTPLAPPAELKAYAHTMRHAYAELLFHGRSLETLEAVDGIGDGGMTLRLHGHPTSERWLAGAPRAWSVDPLALDGVFQALILWTREQRGAPSLPSRLQSLTLCRPLTTKLRGVVRITSVEGASVTSTVDLLDESGAVAARLEGYVCTVSPTLERAFQPGGAGARPVAPSA